MGHIVNVEARNTYMMSGGFFFFFNNRKKKFSVNCTSFKTLLNYTSCSKAIFPMALFFFELLKHSVVICHQHILQLTIILSLSPQLD